MTQTNDHFLPSTSFPLTIKILSGKTGEVLWSRTVTLAEAKGIASVQVPGYGSTEHYPVSVEFTYGDGTTTIERMQ